jgi:uncharacterized protein with PQ loop repeat
MILGDLLKRTESIELDCVWTNCISFDCFHVFLILINEIIILEKNGVVVRFFNIQIALRPLHLS